MNERVLDSEYMHWAKTKSGAKYNLATSGMPNMSFAQLDFTLDELEITTEYGYGYPPLINSLAELMDVERSSIVTAAGTTFANHLAMATLIAPGDEVWIEQPTYEPILALARYLGATVKRFSRRFDDGFQIDPEELAKGTGNKTKLIVLTNLHNPSGVLLEHERLLAIGKLAQQIGCCVLVDEVYLETFFEDRPTTAAKLGPQFIVTSSLTKAFGLSGLRSGWIIAEENLANRMWRLNDLFASTPVHIAERLSMAVLRQLVQIGRAAKELLDANRAVVNEFFDERDDLEVIKPLAGTIAFPRLLQGNAEEFVELLRHKYETSVAPGKFFEMADHFRLGFTVQPEVLTEGLIRIGRALDEIGNRVSREFSA